MGREACIQRKTVISAGLVAIVTIVMLVGIGLHQNGTPTAGASYRPGYWDEAEYNAWAEVSTEVYLPFVNSDPAWGWHTTAIVQNAGADTATVDLQYYNTVGTLVYVISDKLPPLGSRVYSTTGVFSGSLRVIATEPIAVIANDSPIGPWMGDGLMSYRGVGGSSGGTGINLLPIYRAYQGWNSFFAVQNMDNVTTPITFTFYNLTGTIVYSQTDTLPPRSAHLYDAAAMPGLGTSFYGRARVQSANPVAGVVKAINALTGETVAHNNRRLEQEPEFLLYLPHLSNDHTSAIVIYNMVSVNANVHIQIYDQSGVAVASYLLSPLTPGAARSISLNEAGWSPPVPSAFRGSAVVTSDAPVGALANTTWPIDPPAPTFTGYSGVSVTATTAYVPFVRRTADAVTQIGAQNAGAADTEVTVTYYDENGNSPWTEFATIKPGAAHYFDQGSGGLPDPFRGSAVVTSTEPVAVIGFVSHKRPDTPSLLGLPDGTLTRTNTITFTWSDVGAAGYNFKLNESVFTTTNNYSATVLADGTYTWTVRAFDAAGYYSPYAPPRTLTVSSTFDIYLPLVARDH